MSAAPLPAVEVLGVRVHAVTMTQTLDWVEGVVARRAAAQLCTANPEFIMTAQRNSEFRAVLNAAELVIPDGVGLVWAMRWLGQPAPERVAGSDLIGRIAERAAAHRWRLFFLGAAEGVAERAAAVLQARYPGWVLAGAYAGSPRPEDEEAIVTRIQAGRPDIVFVAYGAPAQDLWVARQRGRLGVPLALGVGGSFDFLAGVTQRAPAWVQRLGLEWVHRLWRQPWRARRIFTATVEFPLAVLRRGR